MTSRNRKSARRPAPTGLSLKAQGCEARATLGDRLAFGSQPQRGCGRNGRPPDDGRNPVGVVRSFRVLPRVGARRQPWAGRHSPVGADAAVAKKRQELVRFTEAPWDKYQVTLAKLRGDRSRVEAGLENFLTQLAYQ